MPINPKTDKRTLIPSLYINFSIVTILQKESSLIDVGIFPTYI